MSSSYDTEKELKKKKLLRETKNLRNIWILKCANKHDIHSFWRHWINLQFALYQDFTLIF